METTTHHIDAPEWVVTRNESGFEVRCTCGWTSPRFDTASLARASAADHIGSSPLASRGDQPRRSRLRLRP